MEKNKLINKKTTNAFNLYAHEIFRKQIEMRINDEPFDFNSGFLSELNLRKAITNYLGAWLTINMPRWKDLKDSHINQEEIDEYSFETYAKLYYCGDMLTNVNCAASTDLDTANMLMSLQYRMAKNKLKIYGYNLSEEERFKELQQTPIYKYLNSVSNETTGLKTCYDEIFDIPVDELADELFERVATLQHKLDKTVILPVIDPYDNGKYTRDWKYKRFKKNDITTLEALELSKANFNDWLDVELREQEVGRTLH